MSTLKSGWPADYYIYEALNKAGKYLAAWQYAVDRNYPRHQYQHIGKWMLTGQAVHIPAPKADRADDIDDAVDIITKQGMHGGDKVALLESMRAQQTRVFVIREEGKAIAAAIVSIEPALLQATVRYVAVLPEYQHRGHGTRLMQRIVDRYASYHITLDARPMTLVPWYKTFGFVPTHIYGFQVKMDYNPMRRVMSAHSLQKMCRELGLAPFTELA